MFSFEKYNDALKAVSEYLKKPQISMLGKANLYKILGCCLMLSEDQVELNQINQSLELSLNNFVTLQ